MKRLAVILAIVAIAFAAKAERVSYKDAEKVARAHYYQTVNAFRATEWSDISLSCVVNPNDANPKYNLYIFDVNGDEGYIVVSSDNRITPVLAYSFECPFNINNMSPGQADFLNYYSESNDLADKADAEIVEANLSEWGYLLAYDPQVRAIRDNVIATSPVLLDGIAWNQDWPFNSMCPAKTGGTSNLKGHAPVGCVATATCQVMKYWNWPSSGTSSYTHSNWANGGNGNITVNFSNQTYNWNSIPDNPSSTENTELAKICYHVGVAVKMYWEADGSGAQTSDVPYALKTYFKYGTDVSCKQKYSYSDANWRAMLKGQIDQKYPMVYSGRPSSGDGHAWNCDGYQIRVTDADTVESFHMNWGWGPYGGNGYYTLDNLTSTATIGGDENNFNTSNQVVINIHPNQTFSTCQSTTISGSEGSFDDGSRAYDYVNNSDCTYVINPTCGSYIELDFSKFDLAEGDYVNVYAGDESSTNLLATYDMDNLPGTTKVKSAFGAMTLNFHTDGNGVADGWRANYTTKSRYCSAAKVTLTEPSGTFGDGSKTCQYLKNTTCEWWISPENINSVTISFNEFNISSDGTDYVALYHDNTNLSNQVVKYTSNNLPTEPITIPGSVVCVKFYSNNNTQVGDGWLLSYTSDNVTNIEDIEIMSNLSVVPNPTSDDGRIVFTLTSASNTKITITNMLGQIVGQQEYALPSGYHEISLKDFSNLSLQNQMYFVTLQNENQIKTCKFLFAE